MKPNNQSYDALLHKLGLDRGIPWSENWTATADFLQLIADHCLQYQPDIIVECSSGLTTLVLARCCQLNQRGHVYSLENGEEYANTSRDWLRQYELEQFATVIYAPLTPQIVDEMSFQWYETHSLPEQTIDMLVIDGPPGFIQPLSRYPALPRFYGQLANSAIIYLDDAAREDEILIIQRWMENFPGLSHEFIATERGCSVLKVTKELPQAVFI